MSVVVDEPSAGFREGSRKWVVLPSEVARASSSGWLPALALASALGLLAIVLAHALSRSARSGGDALFWLGLVCIVLPTGWRLLSDAAARTERIALVALAGIALYLVKVTRDPFEFTFTDELVHEYNVGAILRTHDLFEPNPILLATPNYPGLEATTAALASLSGLTTFGAGLVVVGAARLVMTLALFFLFEQITSSARVAGIATLLYSGAANYLYFSAQFSYESLALPLTVFLAYCVVRWIKEDEPSSQRAWAWVTVIVTAGVVVTHHMSSYAVIAFLFAAAVTHGRVARDPRPRSLWPFFLFATFAAGVWLAFVARETVGYLSPVFSNALEAAIDTVGQEAPPRTLFTSDLGVQAHLWERTIGIASVAVVALALPFGLLAVWRRHRNDAIAIVLSLAATAYLGTFALRLVPQAWEVAIRASNFLFVGVALLLALTGLERWSTRRVPWAGRGLALAALGIILAGGVISGWPRELRLAQTYRPAVGDEIIEPQGRTVARWSREQLGTNRRFAADVSNGRLLLAHGDQFARVGSNPPIDLVIRLPTMDPWETRLLADEEIRYVLVDRRFVSEDALSGYFFTTATSPDVRRLIFHPASYRKFDRLRRTSRVFDSGHIVVYDVKKLVARARGR